jgi:hypothetical protein
VIPAESGQPFWTCSEQARNPMIMSYGIALIVIILIEGFVWRLVLGKNVSLFYAKRW